MTTNYCVVCDREVSEDVIVCGECAKGLGYPRERNAESILSFKVERRRRS